MPDEKAIRTMKPGDLQIRAIEAFSRHLKLEDGQEAYLEQLRALSEEQAGLFAAFWCDAEVCNGGFYQFFLNSTGLVAPEAIRGFEMIDLAPVARIVEKAMRMLGAVYPRDQKWRTAVLKRIHRPKDLEADRSPFAAQDDAYYKAVAGSEFRSRADEFVRGNLDRFFE